MRGLLDTIGIQTSLALQHGIPLRTICQKLSHTKFEPAGRTRNAAPELSTCSSIIDYVFRWMAYTFEEFLDAGQEECCHE